MPAAKPPEFRRRALDLVAQGNPVGQVAKNVGVSESRLRRWMSIDDVNAGCKEGLTSSERKELVEFRRRNQVLEMEREILRRASAFLGEGEHFPNTVIRLVHTIHVARTGGAQGPCRIANGPGSSDRS